MLPESPAGEGGGPSQMTSGQFERAMVTLLVAGGELAKAGDEAAAWRSLERSLQRLVRDAVCIPANPEGRLVPDTLRAMTPPVAGLLAAIEQAPRDGRTRSQGGWSARGMWDEDALIGAIAWRPDHGDDPSARFGHAIDMLIQSGAAAVVRTRAIQRSGSPDAGAQSVEIRDALISSVSHDFCTPLASIIGSATSLLEYGDRFDPAVTRDLLTIIKDEGERLNTFVENLLSYTRIHAGAVNPNLRSTSLNEVIGIVVERLESRFSGTQLLLKLPESDPAVLVDPLLLEHALFNVVDNAIKYGPKQGRVTIEAARVDQACLLQVEDEGPGLAPEDRALVFERFHRACADTTLDRGAGLGLSIAKGFIEALGGMIEALARLDGRRGLRVRISLPAAL